MEIIKYINKKHLQMQVFFYLASDLIWCFYYA
uniref:Uncharacterized protein n=1 Tax=Siphoviridae sp. ctES717 TaxID=2827564 RepID=A0A8S5RS90_9CAUD|nr:MAG TPA: hypothetical protein [Siphoviridae sp. ctES717]